MSNNILFIKGDNVENNNACINLNNNALLIDTIGNGIYLGNATSNPDMIAIGPNNIKTINNQSVIGYGNIELLCSQLIKLNNTNNSQSVDLYSNEVLVFSKAQIFSSKTFNIKLTDSIYDYTWTLKFQLSSTSPTITFNVPTNYTLKWANGITPTFSGNGAIYEITFKHIPTINAILGVVGEFK
jgi:hypothetical protein